MAIETRFIPVPAVFLAFVAVLAPVPASTDQLLSSAPELIEEAALPPVPEDIDPGLVQHPGDDPGSGATIADAEAQATELEEATVEEATEPEPWAEEVAEAIRPSGPPYEVVVNEKVQYFIDRYTGARREVISLWLDRSSRYLDMIRATFRARGIPEDLAFVAMIESGYNPKAVSRAGAKGLWQFMAATARRYGLRVDQWVDERFDPVKSTSAAAAYLHDLHAIFGSWPLAKAGYNAGEQKVARAIRLTGTNDFWALARSRFLKQETKDFVPAIHAATVIGRDPLRFGFEPGAADVPLTTTVRVPARTNLAALSAKSGIPLETLRRLNPVLVRSMTPPGSPYDLTVPEGTDGLVLAALAPRKPATKIRSGKAVAVATGGDIHVVQPNETLKGIAHRHGVTVANLLRWNSLSDPDRIRPGDRLRVADVRVSADPVAAPRSR